MKPPPAFMKRKSNMTLEKLLIFGFALAALLAITTLATNVMNTRGETESELQDGLGDLAGAGQ